MSGKYVFVSSGDVTRADLADTTDSSKGSRLVTWFTGLTGFVWRWVSDKLLDTVSTKDFGAAGDWNGTTGTDDTAAIQTAINWCSANKKKLVQVGWSKITSPLTWPSAQIHIVGAGAARTYDSGWHYSGTGTMVAGQTADVKLYFTRLENLVFEGPGIGSGVDGFYGDFYQGGAEGCIFTGWRTAVQCFGSINTFRHNRFVSNVNGLIVTSWPLTSSQPGVSTTTFLSERNDYFGNTGYGLKVDSSGESGANFLSSASRSDVFEQNGVGLYLNKSYCFTVDQPHFELHSTWAIHSINSAVNIINPLYSGTDATKVSVTFPGAAANAGGYTQLDLSGVKTNAVALTTLGTNVATISANDAGNLVLGGAGVVGAFTPAVSSSGGVSAGNAYSLQEGYYTRIGKFTIAVFRIVMTAKDAGMAGVINITGFPFAADGSYSNAYGNQLRYSDVTLNGGTYTELLCDMVPGATYAQPFKQGSGLAPLNLAPADLAATSTLSGTVVYLAA